MRAERQAVLEEMSRERAAIIADVEALIEASTTVVFSEAETRGDRMLDGVTRRFVMVMAIPFLAMVGVCAAALIIAARALPPRQRNP